MAVKCKCGHEFKVHAIPSKHVDMTSHCANWECECKEYIKEE